GEVRMEGVDARELHLWPLGRAAQIVDQRPAEIEDHRLERLGDRRSAPRRGCDGIGCEGQTRFVSRTHAKSLPNRERMEGRRWPAVASFQEALRGVGSGR